MHEFVCLRRHVQTDLLAARNSEPIGYSLLMHT